MVNKNLSVSLCGCTLPNPIVPASGTFGFGLELADTLDLNKIGGISLKGTTRDARFGNPTPRIAECTGGLINSVGLQNPGIDVLVEEKVPALRKIYHNAIIANISGSALRSMRIVARKLLRVKVLIYLKLIFPALMFTEVAWPLVQAQKLQLK